MSTEPLPEIDLDTTEVAAITDSQQPKDPSSLLLLNGSVENIERIARALLNLRSENRSALLLLRKPDFPLEDDEVRALFQVLRDTDQLTLQNILSLCEDWIPRAFTATLQNEAKIEMKWFREWLTALNDSRIHKYPTVPWRSFIRKIISENYAFATKFLELVALPANPENLGAVQNHFNQFFEAKKKVVCLFPKRWEKLA